MPLPPKHKLLYIFAFWIIQPTARGLIKVIDVVEWLFKVSPSIPSRIPLLTAFGTEVQVHRLTFIYVFWFMYGGWQEGHTLKSVGFGVAYLVATFVTITLHEFGHVLTARAYGIKTKTILLNPFGGMAEMDMGHLLVPARQEFFITIAGPLVNAVLFLFFTTIWDMPTDVKNLPLFSWEGFKFGMICLNVLVFFFNFLPVFPMDGGRIFRSILMGVFRMSVVKSTQVTCWVAFIVGTAFGCWAAFTGRLIIALAMPLMLLLAVAEYARVKRLVAEYNAAVEQYNSSLANEA